MREKLPYPVLFPYTGTSVSFEYVTTPSYALSDNVSDLTFTVTQPVGQNAFGAATRLLDEIVDVEVEVVRFQIVEAYEDYLALLMSRYLDWYAAYENLNIARSSYQEKFKAFREYQAKRKKVKLLYPLT